MSTYKGGEQSPPHGGATNYPEYGVLPDRYMLTACETLCWIAYKRAIPKELYFAPLDQPGALAAPADEREAMLHDAIPQPKPDHNLTPDAGRELMTALRSGAVRMMLMDKSTRAISEVPASAFDSEYVVSVRGDFAPSATASIEWYDAHQRHAPVSSELYFPAPEVLLRWPAPSHAERLQEVKASDASKMRNFLATYMREHSGNARIMSKQDLRKLGGEAGLKELPQKTFDRTWAEAIGLSGVSAWGASGRKIKSPR
jgi:hypothetical protein